MFLHRQQITIVAPNKIEPESLAAALSVLGVCAAQINSSVLVETPEDKPEKALILPSTAEVTKVELDLRRQEVAEAAFEAYLADVESTAHIVGSDGWVKECPSFPETSRPLWRRAYFVSQKGKDSQRKLFAIEFQPNTSVISH